MCMELIEAATGFDTVVCEPGEVRFASDTGTYFWAAGYAFAMRMRRTEQDGEQVFTTEFGERNESGEFASFMTHEGTPRESITDRFVMADAALSAVLCELIPDQRAMLVRKAQADIDEPGARLIMWMVALESLLDDLLDTEAHREFRSAPA
jgi:hypothetical protein